MIANCQIGIDKMRAEVGETRASGTSDAKYSPMSKLIARKIHADNLATLRDAREGEGNHLLNATAFFAGKAFAGGALESTAEQIRAEILGVVLREWKSPYRPERTARATLDSGWYDGEAEPLDIREDTDDDEIEIRDWPEPPAPEAFAGLVGDFVRLWEPHTEASPVALAAQFLVFFGRAVGRQPFYAVGGDDHHTNLELALVGPTSFARKGQSYSCVKLTFDKVLLDDGHQHRVATFIEARGLSTGEGLIAAVRDPRSERNKKGEVVTVDDGIADKRLLVFESEFASVLRRMVREGNTLSEVMRQAWDSGDLGTMTRNAPLRASDAHISIVTHVTPSDLQLYLNDVSAMNGFANRIVFIATRRVKSLPDPGRPSELTLADFATRLAGVIEFGKTVRDMHRSAEAIVAWKDLYEHLSAPRTGRQHNATVARAPAHVLRLSMIYALLGQSAVIQAKHLVSAAALWDYAERTSRFVFGDSLGDKVAEQILEMLRAEPKGMMTKEIRAKIGDKKRVPDALRLLHENGQVRQEALKQPGASPYKRGQRWFMS